MYLVLRPKISLVWGPTRRATHCATSTPIRLSYPSWAPGLARLTVRRALEVPLKPVSNVVEEIDSDETERILTVAAALQQVFHDTARPSHVLLPVLESR